VGGSARDALTGGAEGATAKGSTLFSPNGLLSWGCARVATGAEIGEVTGVAWDGEFVGTSVCFTGVVTGFAAATGVEPFASVGLAPAPKNGKIGAFSVTFSTTPPFR
jgi:hypothetical protein